MDDMTCFTMGKKSSSTNLTVMCPGAIAAVVISLAFGAPTSLE